MMRFLARSLVSAAVVFLAIFAAAAVAWAETCTLELKRINAENTADSAYRAAFPQNVFIQLGKDQAPIANQPPIAAFKRLVKKEPKYQTKNPICAVVTLGGQEYAFALDAVPPPAKAAKKDADKAKKSGAEKPKTETGTAALAGQLFKTLAGDKTPPLPVFNRLYFDKNHNGDLTDDPPIDLPPQRGVQPLGTFFQFPRIDIVVNDAGTKLDYSFFLDGRAISSPQFSYVLVTVNPGAYRDGEITLAGKKHHIVLLDFNGNARFNDEIKLIDITMMRDGKPVTEQRPNPGDMLLIDPVANAGPQYDVTSSDSLNYVTKLVNIGGHFYSVKISPAGDKLTLELSTIPLGGMKNASGTFRAVLMGDQGVIKIRGEKDTPAVVPEGTWKLLSYSIDLTEAEKAKQPGEKKPEKKGSALEALGSQLNSLLGDSTSDAGVRSSIVSAQIEGDYKPVKVVKGETVALPFGPPYKPVVTANYYEDAPRKVLSLAMSLVGTAGETCSEMMVKGSRPPKPKFTITDAKGKVIEQGSFEYG
jgi:hypothetical protein